MNAENPGPDNDTMFTLIETNDLLSLAMSRHQRALLKARKENSAPQDVTSQETSRAGESNGFRVPASDSAPLLPGREPSGNGTTSSHTGTPISPSNTSPSPPSERDNPNPFADPAAASHADVTAAMPPTQSESQPAALEPYHPAFNPTASYMGRQESSVGHATMHAAIPTTPAAELDGEQVAAPQPAYRY